jgi:hypothetical protein
MRLIPSASEMYAVAKAEHSNQQAHVAAVTLLLLTACSAPPRAEPAKPDPTRDAAYTDAINQLASLNRQAADLLQRGRSDDAAAAITHGQPLQTRLLAAPQPTLAAMQAVSDLDDLYARMLLANHNDGWARILYQKNVIRWQTWKPQTADTMRRLRQARERVEECDRRLAR